MKVPIIDRFFYCISLQAGTKAIAYVKLGLHFLLGAYVFIAFIHNFSKTSFGHAIFGPIVVKVTTLCFVETYFAASLLYGVYKRKPVYLKIWILIQIGIFVQNLYMIIAWGLFDILSATLHVVEPIHQNHIIAVVVFIVLDLYTTLTVYSYYKHEYKRDRQGNLIEEEDFFDDISLKL